MSEEKTAGIKQYLTFRLGEETFALDVAQVREILDVTVITKVPQSPDFMRGVINVRGSVVPVVDLRMKFGLEKVENTVDTRIVVMEVFLEGEITVVGAMADSVHDVMELEDTQIEPLPKIGARWCTEFIRGLGKVDNGFVIVLNIDRFFSTEELAVIKCAEDEIEDEASELTV